MSDTVEKHKTSMAIQNVKVYVAEVNQRNQRVILCDDYMTLANKYDSLREMYGELTGKFFKSAERLASELGKRQALLMKYEKKVQECQDAREIAFGYMQDADLVESEAEDLRHQLFDLSIRLGNIQGWADEVAEALRFELMKDEGRPKPECLLQYEAISNELRAIYDENKAETDKTATDE